MHKKGDVQSQQVYQKDHMQVAKTNTTEPPYHKYQFKNIPEELVFYYKILSFLFV